MPQHTTRRTAAVVALLSALAGCATDSAHPEPDPDTAVLARSYLAAATSGDLARLREVAGYVLEDGSLLTGATLPDACLEAEVIDLVAVGVRADSSITVDRILDGTDLVQFGTSAGASVGRGVVPLAGGSARIQLRPGHACNVALAATG